MLNDMGIESKVADVDDNNDIDREVHRYKPTHVIIEALWVIPHKFKILKKLHPKVKWICRLHSDFPFLASEGIALDWLFDYVKCGVSIITNCDETAAELGRVLKIKVPYLPNYYPVTADYLGHELKLREWSHRHHINIGCFGAIRPLKNQLLQAFAAIQFAERHNLRLNFWINTGRIEMGGAPILKNLEDLFENVPHHKLIEVGWLPYDYFLRLLKEEIDLGMQVSFAETYNIVTADMVNLNIPVVVSSEVYWVSPRCMARPNSIKHIVNTMGSVCAERKEIVRINKDMMIKENAISKTMWRAYFSPHLHRR
jgi:hypothetical protein